MKLYELAREYEALLEAADGEEAAFSQALDQLGGELAAKALAVAKVVKTLEAEAAGYKAEETRLSERRKARENAADRLKGYLKDNLIAAGLAHVQGDVVDLRIQDGPPSVEVVDEIHLGNEWKRAVLKLPLTRVPEELIGEAQVEVDRRGILDWVKAGNTAPEGTVVTRGKFLRIR